jgi:putative sigma-54 modulation protein
MSIQVVFRNIEATEALKDHATKRVEKFRKLVTYPMEIHVLLSLQKTYQAAEVTCRAEHKELVATGKTKNMYESIDEACHKIENQIKKNREKRKGHGSAHLATRPKSLRAAADVEAEIPHREKKILR